MKKIRVGLVFGGKSGEHEVSLQSAKSVYEALDKNKYEVHLIGIDKKGRWLLEHGSQFLLNSENPRLIALNRANSSEIVPRQTPAAAQLLQVADGSTQGSVDVFLAIMHGTYGDDGSMQGLFEVLDTAYVGAGVLGSAVGMDKDIMKRLLLQAHIPVTAYVSLKKGEATSKTLNDVVRQLGLPLFIKPANLGSSVGVTKVKNKRELATAVKKAFLYDTKILVEQMVVGREVECSVLGNDKPIASVPGEIIPSHEFYSYEAKYIDEHGAVLKIPADLPQNTTKKVREMAVRVFTTLECMGMARVDFFVTERGEVIVNEINTIPGFTKISMYPKLWEASGMSYRKLLDTLIELAIERKKEKDALKRSFSSLD